MITKLCEMAATYHTDKAGWYTPFYDLLFEPRRHEYRKILEVGIGTNEAMAHVPGYAPGASLFMWRDYFPDAEIWGVDIDEQVSKIAGAGVHCVTSDSRAPDLASKLPSSFDLIIDDGCHEPDAQIETFLNLFPILKDGGLYIIEDAGLWVELSARLEGYSHQVVLSPHAGTIGKLILIRK